MSTRPIHTKNTVLTTLWNTSDENTLSTTEYIERASDFAEKRAGHVAGCHDGKDIVQRLVEKIWLKVDLYVMTYPVPETLVSVMLPQAVVDHRRREAAQRGQGARFARTMVPWESIDVEKYDPRAVTRDHEANLELSETLHNALHAAREEWGVKERALRVLLRVAVDDMSVTEAATYEGVTRETAQRDLGAARTALRELIAA